VPREAIVANLNMDQVPGLHPLRDLALLGLEMTNLGDDARAAATSLGLAINPDPTPEQGFFGRGDNLRFVQAHIPALRIGAGDLVDGSIATGRAQHEEFLARRYHTPQDEWSEAIDFKAIADFARFAFVFGERIASSPVRPLLTKP